MAFDLGGLLGDWASAAISAKYAPPPPMAAAVAAPAMAPLSPANLQTLQGGAMPVGYQTAGLGEGIGIPGYDIVDTDKGKGWVYDPNANCGTGKWIRKRRRRHRNLATRGDIRDLSALKGVLGTGKLLETWIATHS